MVSFAGAISLGFQRYFDFSGRSSRSEFWWWGLFVFISSVVLTFADIGIGTHHEETQTGLLTTVFRLGSLIPGIAVGVRRLHDINRTGWWLWMYAISFLIIPFVILFVWSVKRSDPGENKYGPAFQSIES